MERHLPFPLDDSCGFCKHVPARELRVKNIHWFPQEVTHFHTVLRCSSVGSLTKIWDSLFCGERVEKNPRRDMLIPQKLHLGKAFLYQPQAIPSARVGCVCHQRGKPPHQIDPIPKARPFLWTGRNSADNLLRGTDLRRPRFRLQRYFASQRFPGMTTDKRNGIQYIYLEPQMCSLVIRHTSAWSQVLDIRFVWQKY